MKAVRHTEIPEVQMKSPAVKNVSGKVLIGKADGAPNFCMRRFEIGPEGFTPQHSHDWEHEVFVLEGEGEVFLEEGWHPVQGGSVVFVPANVPHQFRNTGRDTLAFICLVPSGAPEL